MRVLVAAVLAAVGGFASLAVVFWVTYGGHGAKPLPRWLVRLAWIAALSLSCRGAMVLLGWATQ